jgi:hypothetical protein
MFAHRLGLALGMTLGQLKYWMTNQEYRSWRAYYKLEPFGWQDREYRTAAIVAMLHNVNAKYTRKVGYFMRDPEKAVNDQINQAKAREKWLSATKQERMAMLHASISAMGIKAKVEK